VKKILFLLFLSNCLQCTNPKHNFKIYKEKTFFTRLRSEPENLHPIKSTDVYSNIIHSYTLESLLQRNITTYEWEPLLAKSWTISPDNKTFTFEIFNNLKWSDGKDLTVQDIKFSFLAYKDPAYGGIHYLPYLEKIESVTILSDSKIQFQAKEVYFGNFQVIANLDIIPEHIYKDSKAKLSKTVIGSGPYMISHYIKGKILVLKKNPYWQRENNPALKNTFSFPNIAYRFISDETDSLLRMEKEHLDFSSLTAEAYLKKTLSEVWKTKIKKVEFSNKQPSNYGYIAFNLKRKLFQDQKLRKALALLLNRELIKEKIFYNKVELARGPWYFWSDYADSEVQAIKFNPQLAKKLLKESGWADRDQNGILEKEFEGRKKELSFTLIFANKDAEQYLTIYQEDLKKNGIQLKLKTLDWTSFLKIIDDKNFDTVALGWGGGSVDLDPKGIWHSSSSKKGGHNFISYSNLKVDALIEKGRSTMNRQERIKIFKKVYRLIASDVPYIFLFNTKKNFYSVNQRIKTYKPSFNYSIGVKFWRFKLLDE